MSRQNGTRNPNPDVNIEIALIIRELARLQLEQANLLSRLRLLVFEPAIEELQEFQQFERDWLNQENISYGDESEDGTGQPPEEVVDSDSVQEDSDDERSIQIGDFVKLHYALPPIPTRGRVHEIENGIATIESRGGFVTKTSTNNLSVIERAE